MLEQLLPCGFKLSSDGDALPGAAGVSRAVSTAFGKDQEVMTAGMTKRHSRRGLHSDAR